MPDFTVTRYFELLLQLIGLDRQILTFKQFIEKASLRFIILRQDVDDLKENSLRFARIQAKQGICGSYYFRVVQQSWDEKIILEIASLGHEIGYHYETMDTSRGNIDKAWDEFRRNLDMFRRIVPVSTICMHGSPRSIYDNRSLWKKYDYHTLGLIGEPYFDIDFSEVGYLTDTGRRWNGSGVSIRDKVSSGFEINLRSTAEIIENVNLLPDRMMFTFHPQRWTNNPILWIRELGIQNFKNVGKYFIVKMNRD